MRLSFNMVETNVLYCIEHTIYIFKGINRDETGYSWYTLRLAENFMGDPYVDCSIFPNSDISIGNNRTTSSIVIGDEKKEFFQQVSDFFSSSSNRDYGNIEALEVYKAVKRAFPDFECVVEHCETCGTTVPPIFMRGSWNTEGRECIACYSKYKASCRRCGNEFRKTSNCETRDGNVLCPQCAKRNYVLPYHRFYPQLTFFGSKIASNSQLYLGVELEVDEGGESDREAEKIVNIFNKNGIFAYCSHDSSIHDGFEIITQPATLTYHNSIKHIYKQAFDTLLQDGYCSHDTSTCGLHVHFNRDFYADNEEVYISHLLYLVDKFWDDIVRVSRRNKRRMNYTRKVDMDINRYISVTNKSESHNYHYYAINLINQNTIEFRMFRGTLNLTTFLATLQFVQNCILAAKEKSAEEIQQMKFDDLITGRNLISYWKRRKGLENTEE